MKFREGFWKVELHVHLDGAFRPGTILDIARERNIQLPSSKSVEEFDEFLRVEKPGNLTAFLSKFPIFLPVVAGNKEAIRRTASEFVEDCARQKIAYVEGRFAPHILTGNDLTAGDVTTIILESIREASEKFGTICNIILVILRNQPENSSDIIELAEKYFRKGVVGIDIAGDELLNNGKVPDKIVEAFVKARQLGIPRTAHAGENGPVDSAKQAFYELQPQRIGHGYKILENKKFYEEVKAKDIHFETCPLSSCLTGGASPDWSKHPIITFCKDRVNYSINTDDPIITGYPLPHEYEICQRELHLDPAEIVRCNFNAAKSSFLDDKEKKELLDHMRKSINAN